ncbi:hypothetical protein MYU51_010489 [Penicillium brevicompactum]
MCDTQCVVTEVEVESPLAETVADVATAFVEAINRGQPTPGTLHRSLKIALAHLVAEIRSIQVLHALTRRKSLEKSLRNVADSLDRALCGEYIRIQYRQSLEEEAKAQAPTFPHFFSFFAKPKSPPLADEIQWPKGPYPHLSLFHRLITRSDVRNLNIDEFLTRDYLLLQKLVRLVKGWNLLVDDLYDSTEVDEDVETSCAHCPKPPAVEAIFPREESVRKLSASLHNSLHTNWPCQLEHHDHNGRLGLSLEAKFFLDPQWSASKQPHESLFMLLTGPEILQECRVCVSDYGNEQGSPACLIMHDDQSRSVCLYLTTDGENRLRDRERLARPLEVILEGEIYIEMSLTKLQSLIKPTYAAKRVMGVTLARCILHLFEGPWLSECMSIDDIYVFCKVQNEQPYPQFDKVFIATKFGPNDDPGTQSRGYKIHPFPTILALGIILLEIELGEDILDIKSDPSFFAKTQKPFYVAQHLLKEYQKRFNLDSGLVSAVTFCIDRASFAQFDTLDSEALLSNQQFIDIYYKRIVRPLEQDLVSGAHWTWDQVEQLESPSFPDAGICKVFTKGVIEPPSVRLCDLATRYGRSVFSVVKPTSTRNVPRNVPMPVVKEHSMTSYQTSDPFDANRAVMTSTAHSSPTASSKQVQKCHPRPLTRNDFTVAIICALRTEANAVEAIFEKYWEDDNGVYTYGKQPNDPNSYTVGMIANQNVVLAHQPRMGKASAANVAAACSISFPSIKLALIVGVCGGVPFPGGNTEILLGDVVISKGIIQYDFGRRYPGKFRRKATVDDQPGRPGREISSLLARLETNKHRTNLQEKIATELRHMSDNLNPDAKIFYPGEAEDKLFPATYVHKHRGVSRCCGDCDDGICEDAIDSNCAELHCDQEALVPRSRRNIHNKPAIHFGLIASGDTVLKSGADRDLISNEAKVIAFEMEGSGVWDAIPCVIIKGVCDYADSHKNKKWQDYAATTAAVSAKAFLRHWL